jgi:dTDP-4-amino-4,6-dideoxygalactose transaminase
MNKILMLDLKNQHNKIEKKILENFHKIIQNSDFINGIEVKSFENKFSKYLNTKNVISCANGTDALQIALMSLNLNINDEVIIPSFTYAATAEVICLLKLKPVIVDVNYDTFNINVDLIESQISRKTKVIIPVHLFGQSAEMKKLNDIAKKYNIIVIEDAAQSIGAFYKFSETNYKQTGTIGNIGCTSFFPSKNLGCMGDGGAIITNNFNIAKRIRMIANHGQKIKYNHEIIGINSRLDTLQASVLNIKLGLLDNYIKSRQNAAKYYDKNLSVLNEIVIPHKSANSTHTYHQYVIKVKKNKRDKLRSYLKSFNIPTMIYYPTEIYKQKAFSNFCKNSNQSKVASKLVNEVLALPIHTEISKLDLSFICNKIKNFYE